MTMTATPSHRETTDRSGVEAAQDAELAALIRRLATKRPEILTAWTPPPPQSPRLAAPPAPRTAPPPVPGPLRPHLLPIPRPLSALTPHPVAGDHPTREAFPVPRATVDSLARLRAIAAGTHRPDAYWPAHATDAYLAKKRRPTRWRRAICALTQEVPRTYSIISVLVVTIFSLPPSFS